jgi:hypothetical protein
MWVLEALFKSIQRTNSGAKGSFDAVVRKIDAVKVAYDATNRYPLGEGEGRIQVTRAPTAPDATSSLGGPDAGAASPNWEPHRPYSKQGGADSGRDFSSPRSGGRPGRSGGRGGRDIAPPPIQEAAPTDAAAGPVDPLNNGRYVNAKGRPLTAADLQSPALPPEYRLMAFKLRLVVDESQLQRVVEELANSTLPLEVREVRINVAADVTEPGAQRGRGSRQTNSLASAAGGATHNATLDIRGVAYLINAPDRAKLGLPATVESPAGSVPPATGNSTTQTPPVTAPTGVAATTGATLPAPAPAAPAPAAAAPQTNGAADSTPPSK